MSARVGLGIDYTHSYGHKLTELLQLAPNGISHLSVVAIPNEDVAYTFRNAFSQYPMIHHFSGMEPAGIDGLRPDVLVKQNAISKILKAVWCLEDIGIWNIGPYNLPYFAAPVLCEPVLAMTIEGVKKIQSVSSIPFSAEIPSFSIAAGDMALGKFFHRLVDATGCNVVLDISHVFSYSIYFDQQPEAVLTSLPLSAVNEIHIAGGSVHPTHSWRYRDTHSEPIVDDVFPLLEQALAQCPNLKAVTYELGVGITPDVIRTDLRNIEYVCQQMAFTPSF
ncbi:MULTISPECIES: multinuclear nonheme iron-dependent oxidase [Photorhabdus]|uniref:DUF692 family protein n=1 Tax=Photorhabdus kayaii TaxID=230088 RepID=A0ABX0AZ21_9GAMM|nr:MULTISPECIES: DUF692 family multinuclear iron-containing protein [Photorhabdus]MCC8374513.1 DUF692 family protein [Photorhabdus bodei]MCT8354347.1 DUF692 family protein [Photorhabdus kayaii]MDB6368625.1 DUF692 family protein [Photorhabdus bodei]NDL12461.1 DUF692 family protein [Photorhabdus kayaii]NDL26041.1 DUF692 family protein [Photorhabdus kayaii]